MQTFLWNIIVLSIHAKMKLYKTLMKLIVTSGVEIWRSTANKLDECSREGCLRENLGLWKTVVWSNQEINEFINQSRAYDLISRHAVSIMHSGQ